MIAIFRDPITGQFLAGKLPPKKRDRTGEYQRYKPYRKKGRSEIPPTTINAVTKEQPFRRHKPTKGQDVNLGLVEDNVMAVVELPIGHPERAFRASKLMVSLRICLFNNTNNVDRLTFFQFEGLFKDRVTSLKRAIKALKLVLEQESLTKIVSEKAIKTLELVD
jgi:hypothetical protein